MLLLLLHYQVPDSQERPSIIPTMTSTMMYLALSLHWMTTATTTCLAWTAPIGRQIARATTLTTTTQLGAIKAIRPEIELGDLTGGRPGAIIESEAELERKAEMFQELEQGIRTIPSWMSDYGELLSEIEAVFDTDDPEALNSNKLGDWDISFLKSKFNYELDPSKGDDDPNAEYSKTKRYVKENPKDDDGVDIGYNPIFGHSNPIDTRTIVGTLDSYMIDEESRDEGMLTPVFAPGDMEIAINEDIRTFRKSLDIIETYADPFFLEYEVPRHMQRWYGYPEPMTYPQKNYTNNRFTTDEDRTDFDSFPPHKARTLAVQYARAKNAEWLPPTKSLEFHTNARAPYEKYGTLVGTLEHGECDAAVVEIIQPALKVLGSIADLLSIDGNIYRFYYHGLIKDKFGMSCWAQTLLQDCGVEVDNVIFETGFRKRDPWYDGGSPWYGPY